MNTLIISINILSTQKEDHAYRISKGHTLVEPWENGLNYQSFDFYVICENLKANDIFELYRYYYLEYIIVVFFIWWYWKIKLLNYTICYVQWFLLKLHALELNHLIKIYDNSYM